ncbi:MAG: spermidine/putrescine ABC transporter substrate-binding protein [Bacteroidota bacterium]|jgi:spermidine/putrescine-binding protein
MTKTSKVYRASRIFLAAFILLLAAGCSAKPTEVTKHITSSGFTCPEPNPKIDFKSKEINIFTWTEYIPADMLECFGLVYDVKVNTDYFSSNEELNAKMSIGKDSNQYDVIHPSDYMIKVLVREGILQTLDQNKLPNMKNLDPELLKAYGDTTSYIVPYQMGTQAIVYNSKTVPNPPTSWADLWNPEYKGRMVAVDDSRVLIGAALLTLGYDINTKDPEQLQQAKEKLLELMPNIKVFDSDSPKTSLIAGDVDLGIVWNGEAFLAQRENPDFQYVFPKEGSIIFYDGMGIPKNAPHADAAYAWLNYQLQGDINWLTLVDYPYTNPNRAALDFAKQNHPDVYEAYINSSITNTPAQYFLQGKNVEDVGEALPLYDEIWTEVKQ